jgi:UDP-N-acetylmuramyl pentapeptide phosphotransferase/UDP-N-acetylglucosamine-1-phosphate transferase
LFQASLIIFLISLAISGLILLLHQRLPHLIARRDDLSAVQKSHLNPTPRIGGLAILVGVLIIPFMQVHQSSGWFIALILSLIPVASAGLAEDLGLVISPRIRLFAAALSSVVAILLLDVWIPRLDVVGLDVLMHWNVLAFTFTIVATAGVSHAFNLIDGLNGLSGGVSVVSLLGLTAIAGHAPGLGAVEIGLLLTAAVLGFLVFNFPFGTIFLGDAGAYSLGHIIVWYSIYLVWTIDDLATWAVALILFWPLADTLYSIYRRRYTGKKLDQPDRLHFHQVVMRTLQIKFLGRNKIALANPLATSVMIPFFIAPTLTGTLLWNQPLLAALALLGFAAAFVLAYQFLIRISTIRVTPKHRSGYWILGSNRDLRAER